MQLRSLSITVPQATHKLEGRLARTAGAAQLALIAPPHPLYGGSIGNPVVRALEGVFQARGLATLAFDFRGVGESTGQPSGSLADALADYLAAARALEDAQLAWLSGYSFGGCAALAAALELGVQRVLLIGPPLALLDPHQLRRFRGQLYVALGDQDEYAPLDDLRATFALAPQARIAVVEGADHFLLGSACQRLAQSVAGLLDDEAA
jgi:alpha/beta superfamily hydrolase